MANKFNRRTLLAKIHIAKKDLGMSDDEYRTVLDVKFGKGSASKLTMPQLSQLVAHFQTLGWEPAPSRGKPKNPPAERSALLSKVEAYLAEAGRPWSYADAMAKRICKVEKIAWCEPEDLAKIVAALEYDRRRHGRFAG